MKKVLINISNHKSADWSQEQKALWSRIIDYSFPNVSPQASIKDLDDEADEFLRIVTQHAKIESGNIYVCLMGEFTLCYLLYEKLNRLIVPSIKFAIPTTDRIVEEQINPDGTTIKKSVFKFVQWRIWD